MVREILMGSLGQLRYEPVDKRIRAKLGGQVVIDTERALLVWEPKRVVPSYAVPFQALEGVATDADEAAAEDSASAGAAAPQLGDRPVYDPSVPFSVHTTNGTVLDLRVAGAERRAAAFRPADDALGEYIIVDFGAFDEWYEEEERNIAHYWEPYRPYKEIAELSLAEAFAHFGISGRSELVHRYFEAFSGFELFPDVAPTLDTLSRRHRLAVVSNIDDDLLAATRLGRDFDLVCTAQRARGYKPDGTLFRYLIEHAGAAKVEILHSGQSQFTDMVGGKPLGLTIAWINRRNVALHESVPRPDYTFADIASLIPLLAGKA